MPDISYIALLIQIYKVLLFGFVLKIKYHHLFSGSFIGLHSSLTVLSVRGTLLSIEDTEIHKTESLLSGSLHFSIRMCLL